ncbi:ureidoglycolate lyase [Gracilibacillus alcaliphilus]|uniref:ureidoglycolate lyase n=1 Tax=Gracilibacillus alcaliphilus TaxID=1401441 RepID=UPI001EF7B996|nr:ureidoglycolate lyase [Gracilibacillus alcaliphilus]MBM7676845.1 ureidoglycolate lyase [Gracilibacillus alcaliphilus]
MSNNSTVQGNMSNYSTVQDINSTAFAPFGKVIEIPNTPPPKVGDGWDCWNYIAMLDVSEPIGMGLVNTKKRELVVDSMERHVSREELLIALDKEIIQPVAICRDIEDPDEEPDVLTVQCFRIKPGQGIVINKGVWHSPAYPANEDCTYLFAIEKKADKFGDEMINPWVPFIDGKKVEMRF